MDKEHENKELEKNELKKVDGGYIAPWQDKRYGIFSDKSGRYLGSAPTKEKARKMAISKGQKSIDMPPESTKVL